MSVGVTIVQGPLGPDPRSTGEPGPGAVLTFEGVVRPDEDDTPISALDYDAYLPMAETMLVELAQDMVESHGLMAMEVEHSVGRVAVGETSFRLRVVSEHRAEGLAAAHEFITKMKQDVPLFKVPVELPAQVESR